MSIFVINTGTSANAGNGDSIRLAFHKVNQNFNYLNTIVLGTGTGITSLVQSTVNPMLVHNLHGGLSAAYEPLNNKIIFLVTGDIPNLASSGIATLNDVVITGTVTIGNVEFIDDLNLIRSVPNGAVNFRIKNVSSGTSEINLTDMTSGSFNIVHNNSTASTFEFAPGQNYIYDTNNRAINIGRAGPINFYSSATFSGYVAPAVRIASTGVFIRSTLTLIQNLLDIGGNHVSVSGTNFVINGVAAIAAPPDRISTGTQSAIINTSGNLILPGNNQIALIPEIQGLTVTNYGSTFSADGPFAGVGSMFFDGNSRVEVGGGPAFDLTTGTYTIEWFQKQVSTSTQSNTIFVLGDLLDHTIQAVNGYSILTTSTATSVSLENAFTVAAAQTSTFTNAWNHVAIVRNNTNFKIFVNGQQKVSSLIGDLPTPVNTTSNLILGTTKLGASYINSFTGYISNMRWSASEVYSTTFTPPSSILTSTPGTRLLFATQNSSTYLIDSSLYKPTKPQSLSLIASTSSLTLSAYGEVLIDQRGAFRTATVFGTLLRIDTDQSRHTQMSVQNYSSATTATSDLILIRNDGSLVNETGMIDIGINSSNYLESAYSIHSTGSAYVFSNDADLIIGTQSAGKKLKFHTDGTTTSDIASEVDANTWTFSRNLLPSLNSSYDLGSNENQWQNLFVSGIVNSRREIHRAFSTSTTATTITAYDCSTAQLFYHSTTGTVANWTANFTNLNLDLGKVTKVQIVINQGNTGYYPSAVQIEGIAQTLNWQGNTNPTPNTNRHDLVTFDILNNNGAYLVLGQLTGF